MPAYNHGKGSVGTSMGLVHVRNGREVKKRPPRRCDCKKCIYAIIHGECVDCYITGEVAVNKNYCIYYKTEEEKNNEKRRKNKKNNGRRISKRRKASCKKSS